MGFTLESRPNPLALLGQAVGDTSLSLGRQNRQQRILDNALGLLNNADDDPMSFLGSISRLNPENQRLALGALDIQRQKQAEAKDQAQAKQLAQQYNIKWAPGMGTKDVIEFIKEQGKLAKENEAKAADRKKATELANKLGIDVPEGSTTKEVLDIAKATKPGKKTQASQPIDPEQLAIIKRIRETPEYKEASPLRKYQILTDAGVSKENAQAESDIAAKESDINSKAFETSYKANEDFIKETTDSYKAFETEMKPRLLQMRNIRDEDLIGPTAAVFLENFGIPLGALADPSSELYQKLSQDLLKGLPETYGNRILKVEVDNFLKTIPQLINSANGRRMIASNMLKLGEMKEVYYNAMRSAQQNALEKGKFPRDFQQAVFDQVKPQIDRINNEFVKLSEIKNIPKNMIPFFAPNGEVKFIPPDKIEWAISNGGRRIW